MGAAAWWEQTMGELTIIEDPFVTRAKESFRECKRLRGYFLRKMLTEGINNVEHRQALAELSAMRRAAFKLLLRAVELSTPSFVVVRRDPAS
jgi:hypothetical protein